jgi:putative tricarboxylic transport membrane protein
MISHLVSGLTNLATASTFLLLLFGMVIGMFMGMLPGLGVVLVLSLMLPFVRHMSVLDAISMMLATQAGVYFAASITAIVLNSPGAPESYPTTLDGYPMAKRGEAGKALAISATSTWLGGWVACVFFVIFIQFAGPLNKIFHPPEYMAIIILAIVLIAQTGSIPLTKVFISGLLGLMLSFVGSDPVTGVERFTMGLPTLYSGIGIVPFALGVFAITQMIKMFGSGRSVASFDSAQLGEGFHAQVRMGIAETFKNWYHVLRSSIIAVFLGLVPGIGGFTANFISYGVGQRVSKDGKKFGTGVTAGLISAEGSSLSKEVGSIIPAVALGLPSGLGMVIFLAALTILGLEPGPTLLNTTPSLSYSMMWVMAIAGFLSCLLGLFLAPQLSKITKVKGPFIFPFIIALSVLGSFASATTLTGVYLLVLFGIIGVIFRDLGYSVAAASIGLVLGGTFDDNVHLTFSLYGWDFLYKSPLADVFLAIAIYLIISAGRRWSKTRAERVAQELKHPLMEWIFDASMLVFSIVYLIVGTGYPTQAGEIPVIVAALAILASGYRLIGDFRTWLKIRNLDYDSAEAELSHLHHIDTTPAPDTQGEAQVAVMTRAEEESEPKSKVDRRKRNMRELAAIGWFVGFAIAAFILGFEIGIPLITIIYSLVIKEFTSVRRRIIFTISAALATGIISYGFVQLFHLTFHGMI